MNTVAKLLLIVEGAVLGWIVQRELDDRFGR